MTITWPADERGPRSVTVVQLPAGCTGIAVVDNVDLGPAIGGVRMSPEVTAAEVARLARAMSLKNATAGLPHGGGKTGIITPPDFDPADRERVVRAFARAIRGLTDYIPGPDMGTNETCMAWIHDEIGRAVGLPAALGGIPLDEIGATGYGLAVCARALAARGELELTGARVAIQGFGAVGTAVARFVADLGAVVVALADRTGAIYDPDGLDVVSLGAAEKAGHMLVDTAGVKHLSWPELYGLECDLIIPAAQPDVVDVGNADAIRAKVILPGANLAVTAAAEPLLAAAGVLVVPDFLANAGGVICAAVEYRGGDRAGAWTAIEEKITASTDEWLDLVRSSGKTPRLAAETMARRHLDAAATYRRRF